jgi:hypothetical protein
MRSKCGEIRAVTGGNDEPFVRVSGGPGAAGADGAGGIGERSEPLGATWYDETSDWNEADGIRSGPRRRNLRCVDDRRRVACSAEA